MAKKRQRRPGGGELPREEAADRVDDALAARALGARVDAGRADEGRARGVGTPGPRAVAIAGEVEVVLDRFELTAPVTLVDLAEMQRRIKVALPGSVVDVHFVGLRVDLVAVSAWWNNVRVERVYVVK